MLIINQMTVLLIFINAFSGKKDYNLKDNILLNKHDCFYDKSGVKGKKMQKIRKKE